MATEKNPYRFVLKDNRLSFVHLKTPVAFEEGADPKYGVTLLMPKGGESHLKVEAKLQQCYDENKNVHFKAIAMTHKNFWYPLRDGDEMAAEMEAKGKDGSAYKGMMFIKATSKNSVNVFDENGEDVIDLDEVYSGCFGSSSVTLWPYSKKGQGIAVYLNSVKKTEDGEPLGGAGGTHDEYEDEEETAPTRPAPRASAPATRSAAAPAPRPAPKPKPVEEPVAQWDVDADGRDIYSWDGINWDYAD